LQVHAWHKLLSLCIGFWMVAFAWWVSGSGVSRVLVVSHDYSCGSVHPIKYCTRQAACFSEPSLEIGRFSRTFNIASYAPVSPVDNCVPKSFI